MERSELKSCLTPITDSAAALGRRLLPGLLALCMLPTAAAPSQALPVRDMNGNVGFDLFQGFGWSVARLDDVDGDGIADFLLGAPFASPGVAFAGQAAVSIISKSLNTEPSVHCSYVGVGEICASFSRFRIRVKFRDLKG